MTNNKELSDKAQENLQHNAELRTKRKTMMHDNLLVLRDGEEAIRIFDPEQIEPQEIDYDGNGEKVQKFDYTITDPNTGKIQIFRASPKTSRDIDSLLIEGHILLKIRRKGLGLKTRYYVTPVSKS
jgi:hypothetical protein